MRYDAVVEWNMTEQEAQAFKLACTWEEVTHRFFPRQKLAHLPKYGDPRKSTLFRYCWRLRRETRGLLREDEYKFYIIANLQIIQANNGRIEPNAICGDKAWVRWKIWKRLYEKKLAEKQGEKIPDQVTFSPKIMMELDCSKRLLFEKSDGDPTPDKMQQFAEEGSLKIWCGTSRLSIYYFLLSPIACRYVDINDLAKEFSLDLPLYKEKISPEVESYFRKEFAHEFANDD